MLKELIFPDRISLLKENEIFQYEEWHCLKSRRQGSIRVVFHERLLALARCGNVHVAEPCVAKGTTSVHQDIHVLCVFSLLY